MNVIHNTCDQSNEKSNRQTIFGYHHYNRCEVVELTCTYSSATSSAAAVGSVAGLETEGKALLYPTLSRP